MNSGYSEILQEIATIASKYGQSLQQPCSETQLDQLQAESIRNLGENPPPAYLAFLRQHNGLDWNGLSVYATERTPVMGSPDAIIGGFVEENLNRRAVPTWSRYLVFADTGDDCYCMRLLDRKYCLLDAVALEQIEEYASFDQMLAEALRKRL